MNEGDTLRIRFDAIAPRGDAIAHTDTKPIYASGVIPGEEAVVTIRKIRRNWIAVDVVEITSLSEHRVEPRCPLFGTCSGCQLQHIAYSRQLELKRDMVRAQLRIFGGFEDAPVEPVIGAADPWHYRNHARFTVRDGRLGYIRRFRKQWFEVPHCYIMDETINRTLESLSGRLAGATQCNIRTGHDEGELMVHPKLSLETPQSGQTHLFETLHGHRFRVSAAAFFQVHRAQAERLVDVLREFVGNDPNATIVDAYAGVGTFAALLANRVARVIAIEESGSAVEDARVNLSGLTNVELRLGRSEELLGTLEGPIDAVILDPPRSGCRPAAIAAVRRFAPARVAYVSCDPASLGRDLRDLCEGGVFDLERITPVDMFPHTHHVECVALLRRKHATRTASPDPRGEASCPPG